jgi:hypothetical protein
VQDTAIPVSLPENRYKRLDSSSAKRPARERLAIIAHILLVKQRAQLYNDKVFEDNDSPVPNSTYKFLTTTCLLVINLTCRPPVSSPHLNPAQLNDEKTLAPPQIIEIVDTPLIITKVEKGLPVL